MFDGGKKTGWLYNILRIYNAYTYVKTRARKINRKVTSKRFLLDWVWFLCSVWTFPIWSETPKKLIRYNTVLGLTDSMTVDCYDITYAAG